MFERRWYLINVTGTVRPITDPKYPAVFPAHRGLKFIHSGAPAANLIAFAGYLEKIFSRKMAQRVGHQESLDANGSGNYDSLGARLF
jgi:hypothetical protein